MARALPERPNIEHLKKEAKQLVRDAQNGDAAALARMNATGGNIAAASAKLSQAQFALAREYGFASWPKLTEHVEVLARRADPERAFAAAVHAGDVPLVRELFAKHPALKRRLNDEMPGFHFGGTPLIAAVHNASREMVDVLLAAGADINQRSHWWAGSFGVLDTDGPLADYLIERGARIDACSAARLGRLNVLASLMTADPTLVHERGGDGKTPLHWAANIAVAEYLIEHGADINARDIDHESTPLQYLIRERQDVARYLVARGAEADIFAAAALGDMPLAKQIMEANPDAIGMTISNRSFPKRDDRAGGTIYIWTLGQHKRPHTIASEFGHAALHDLFMQVSSPVLRLTIACEHGDEAAINQLLNERPSLGATLTGDLRNAIVAVAMNNDTEGVRRMLRAGWPVTAQDTGGATALHWAGFHGNAALARELLAGGAQKDVKDFEFHAAPIGWAEHGSENSWHRDTGDYDAIVGLLRFSK